MPYCPSCGASAASGSRFCSRCGVALDSASSAPPIARPAPAPTPPAPPLIAPPVLEVSYRPVWAALGIGALVAAGAVFVVAGAFLEAGGPGAFEHAGDWSPDFPAVTLDATSDSPPFSPGEALVVLTHAGGSEVAWRDYEIGVLRNGASVKAGFDRSEGCDFAGLRPTGTFSAGDRVYVCATDSSWYAGDRLTLAVWREERLVFEESRRLG